MIGQAIAWSFVVEYLAADRCVAAGGSFDYETGRCDFGAPHPGIALIERHGASLAMSLAFGLAGTILLLRRRK